MRPPTPSGCRDLGPVQRSGPAGPETAPGSTRIPHPRVDGRTLHLPVRHQLPPGERSSRGRATDFSRPVRGREGAPQRGRGLASRPQENESCWGGGWQLVGRRTTTGEGSTPQASGHRAARPAAGMARPATGTALSLAVGASVPGTRGAVVRDRTGPLTSCLLTAPIPRTQGAVVRDRTGPLTSCLLTAPIPRTRGAVVRDRTGPLASCLRTADRPAVGVARPTYQPGPTTRLRPVSCARAWAIPVLTPPRNLVKPRHEVGIGRPGAGHTGQPTGRRGPGGRPGRVPAVSCGPFCVGPDEVVVTSCLGRGVSRLLGRVASPSHGPVHPRVGARLFPRRGGGRTRPHGALNVVPPDGTRSRGTGGRSYATARGH